MAVEAGPASAYYLPMVDTTHRTDAPAGWLEDLAESEAELAAGLTVPGEAVRERVRAALARVDAQQSADGSRRDTLAR